MIGDMNEKKVKYKINRNGENKRSEKLSRKHNSDNGLKFKLQTSHFFTIKINSNH